jgi:hypothetical protein
MKTHILCSTTFSENRTVYEIMSKNTVETEGPQMTSQYGTYALHAGLVRLHACMRMHAPTRSCTHIQSRKHAHACTHRSISNTYCFSTATMIRETASMLRFTYIACLVNINSAGWRCSTIRCWEWHLVLRRTRQQGSRKDYITRSFMLCSHHQI